MFGMNEGPFDSVEKKMHQDMMAAEGSDIDQTWAQKMMIHHQGGIEMSQIVLEQGADPAIQAMARKTIEEQTKDIGELNELLRQHQSA